MREPTYILGSSPFYFSLPTESSIAGLARAGWHDNSGHHPEVLVSSPCIGMSTTTSGMAPIWSHMDTGVGERALFHSICHTQAASTMQFPPPMESTANPQSTPLHQACYATAYRGLVGWWRCWIEFVLPFVVATSLWTLPVFKQVVKMFLSYPFGFLFDIVVLLLFFYLSLVGA